MFEFQSYHFDPKTFLATFSYANSKANFQEKIRFHPSTAPLNLELLDRALFLCFILIGTSYYKTQPSSEVLLHQPIDEFQAKFFSTVYQEGLSQFAFENHLQRQDLAHFVANTKYTEAPIRIQDYHGVLSLQSGGKDSLLTATLFAQQSPTFLYVGSSNSHPAVIDNLPGNLQIIIRQIDHTGLQKAHGLNGHVPITYIIQSLALIQAIINHQNIILTSIGREGDEPHAQIGDLAVNHQWSKTWPAEQLFAEYVTHYISPDLHIGSPLRGYSELKIAELFAQKCWSKFGHTFSSCNVANYRQGQDNARLSWCGECAKCANTYLLFAPFIKPQELDSLFAHQSLFGKPALIDIFKGLLGIDGFMKPFECVGEIAELRKAYELKKPGYPNLPFDVPKSNFDYEKLTPTQPFITKLLEKIGV